MKRKTRKQRMRLREYRLEEMGLANTKATARTVRVTPKTSGQRTSTKTTCHSDRRNIHQPASSTGARVFGAPAFYAPRI